MMIRIYALHLAFGGVEKAISNMANIFCEKYDVEIVTMYDMPNAPAYDLDSRVKVRYLMKDIPNKKEFKEAVQKKNPFSILKEGLKSVKILYNKKRLLIKEFKNIKDGIIITTRHEDTLLLNKYGHADVYKIAQLHHDHYMDEKLLKQFDEDYTNIDVFCLLTDQLKDEVIQHMHTNHHTKCITVPNFLDAIPEKVDLKTKEEIFIATGRLHEVKGFDRMIQMMKNIHEKCPSWKLMIIGDGEDRSQLEKLISDLDMHGYVCMCGQKNSQEIEEFHKKASIYLMTSHSEGLPYVLLEAQSCCLPIVAFDVRVGPRAIVEDGKTGYLVKDKDEEEFIRKAVELAQNRDLREEMSMEAYSNVNKFSRDNISNLWYNILEKKI